MVSYRFVDIVNQRWINLFLDFLLKEDQLTLRTPKKKLFVLASDYHDGNRYILDLYNHRVTFIRSIVLKIILAPFSFQGCSPRTRHAYEQVFSSKKNILGVWNEYETRIGNTLVQMTDADVITAKESLMEFIDPSRPFVSLHVRDNGFYLIKSQNTRNADILTYRKAIELLVERGSTWFTL